MELTMPAQQGRGLHEKQRLAPCGRHTRGHHHPPAIEDAHVRSADVSAQDEHLLAEQGVLGEELGARAERVAQEAEHRGDGVAAEERAGHRCDGDEQIADGGTSERPAVGVRWSEGGVEAHEAVADCRRAVLGLAEIRCGCAS
jgi:hypothetical protein